MDPEKPKDIAEPARIRLGKAELESKMRTIHDRIDRLSGISDLDDLTEEHKSALGRRKLGSWIFESVGGFYLPTENVSKLSVQRQEQLLIRDLIYAFSGVPSSHIRPDISLEKIPQLTAEHIDQVRFKIDESFSGAFRSLANELLPLIGYYISVQSFIEDTIMTTGCGRTLGIELHKSMQQYFELQSALETQLQENKLNLQQLVHQMRPWLVTLEAYASLTSRVRQTEPTSVQLLSLVDDHQKHFKSASLNELITNISSYYMKVVQLWTQKGVLYDVRGEFFVEDTSANAMSSTLLSPKQCCNAYWVQRYRLHMDRLPSFLEPLAENIFLAGKYLNVLRQCNVQMKLMQSTLSYVPGDETHVELIRSSYELPARKLLVVLVQDEQLGQHLRNLQAYFLQQDQDFAKKLMDKCAEHLQCNVDSVIPEKLQRLTSDALHRIDDPFKHMLRSHLMNCDVATQLANRQKRQKDSTDENTATEASSELDAETEVSSETETSSELPDQLFLNGYEAFTLRYEPNWPISLVIHEEPLEQLQLLHRVLFYLRYVQHRLKSSCRAQASFSSHATALHLRMSKCIQQLDQHMSKDIIEPRWRTLLLFVEKAQLVDELLTQFQRTVDQCLQLCLLSEPITFVQSLYTLGQLCLNFCGFLEGPTNDDFEAAVDQYEEEFNSFLLSVSDLVIELAKPNRVRGEDERESIKQLLERLGDKRAPPSEN